MQAHGIFPAAFHGIFLAFITTSGYRVSNKQDPGSILRLELNSEDRKRMQAPPDHSPSFYQQTRPLRADRDSFGAPSGGAAARDLDSAPTRRAATFGGACAPGTTTRRTR